MYEWTLRERVEKESERQRAEIIGLEKRILAKEESLDQRISNIEQKTEAINTHEKELENRAENLKKERTVGR